MDDPKTELATLKRTLDAFRPLKEDQLRALWPMMENDSVYYTYATNAVEGSTLSLSETTVVLVDGVTIGGKTIGEHLDALNGEKAYLHMLDMARKKAPIDEEAIKDLHSYVVGANPNYVGDLYRNSQNYIRGSLHVPRAYEEVRPMMKDATAEYEMDAADEHPIIAAAKLHYNLAAIHPFSDYNGRTARLAMNLSLIQNGYPPVMIEPGEEKARYIAALEASHTDQTPYWPRRTGNPTHFVVYAADLEKRTMERYVGFLRGMESEVAPETTNIPDILEKGSSGRTR